MDQQLSGLSSFMDPPSTLLPKKSSFASSSHSGSSIDVSLTGLGLPHYHQNRQSSYFGAQSPYLTQRRPAKAFRYDSMTPLFAGDWSVNNIIALGSFNEELRNSIILIDATSSQQLQRSPSQLKSQAQLSSSSPRHGPPQQRQPQQRPLQQRQQSASDPIQTMQQPEDELQQQRTQSVSPRLLPITEAPVTLPQTKIAWEPAGSSRLLSSGDALRLWQFQNNQLHAVASYAKRSKSQPHLIPAPLTSFDWNVFNQNKVITSSIDTTCTLWDLASQTVTTQLIAHDQEVNDVAFLAGSQDNFVSVGADGSARLFDLRSLDNSTIIYESPPDEHTKAVVPMLRIAPSPSNENIVCVIGQEQKSALVLDIRATRNPITKLNGHQAPINSLKWIPHAPRMLATGADDCQLLVWDVTRGNFIGVHNEYQQINCVLASPDGNWLGSVNGKSLQAVNTQFI